MDKKPIEITPEMIKAGVEAYYDERCGVPEICDAAVRSAVEAVLRQALALGRMVE